MINCQSRGKVVKMEGCIKEEGVNIFGVVTSASPALGIALGESGAFPNNLPRESPWMQFATEFWNGRAIVLFRAVGVDQSVRCRGAVPWGQPATPRLRLVLVVFNGSRGGGASAT